MSSRIFLSKTSYLKGLQCHKALYLYKNHYELKDPLSPERKERFDLGHKIGLKARELFPGGKDASPSFVHRYQEGLNNTKELLGKADVIYEAAFSASGVIIYADILVKGEGGWKLFEVKSSVRASQTYLDDLALQSHIIRQSGTRLESSCLVLLNEEAGLVKEDTDPKEIFRIEDYSAYCNEKKEETGRNLNSMAFMLAQNRMPSIATGPHCMQPYPCDFRGFCNLQPDSIREGLFGDEA